MLGELDFIEKLAEKGYTKKDAKYILKDFLDVLTDVMVCGEGVRFHGFGTFRVADVKGREMVDMQTKERILIPGHRVAKFTPGESLRRTVKEGFIRE